MAVTSMEPSINHKELRNFAIDSTLLLGISYFTLSFYSSKGFTVNGLSFFEEVFFISILTEAIFYIYELFGKKITLIVKSFFLRFGLIIILSGIAIIGLYFYPPLKEVVYYFLTDNRLAYIALILLLVTFLHKPTLICILNIVYPTQKILILGTGAIAQAMAEEIRKHMWLRHKIVGFVEPKSFNRKEQAAYLSLNQMRTLPEIIAGQKVDKIVVATNQCRGSFPVEELLTCKSRGIKVVEAQTFYEELTGKISLKYLRPSWLIFSPGFKQHRTTRLIKDVLDKFLALAGLVVTTPLMLITALLIKLDSPGPVLFKQERVGEKGRPFVLIKFRTMYHGAEDTSGPVWAKENDERITRIGKVIRKLRIDEIPQMINVLKGEMSFIGPRPERPYFVEKLHKIIPFYTQRLAVKPGITGWAAVKYQYGASVDDAAEKLQYDLYYIKNMSLLLDTLIGFMTILVVLTGKGSR